MSVEWIALDDQLRRLLLKSWKKVEIKTKTLRDTIIDT